MCYQMGCQLQILLHHQVNNVQFNLRDTILLYGTSLFLFFFFFRKSSVLLHVIELFYF